MRIALVALLLTACDPIQEPTFMPVCWEPRGDKQIAHYSPDGSELPCPTGATTITWPHTPLRIFIAWEPDYEDLGPDVQAGIDLWNRNITDHDIFVPAATAQGADVLLRFGSVGDPGLAATSHKIIEGRLHSTVECRRCVASGQTYLTVAHDLGHVLGLAHDPQRVSIMHRSQQPLSSNAFEVKFVTSKDKQALKERYP